MGAKQAVTELFQRAGLSKAELSRRAGISRSSLDDYLSGKRQPSVAQLLRLGEAAGLKLDLVWNETPVEYDPTPAWAQPNPAMDPPPLTMAERASALEMVCGLAMGLPAKPRGPLTFPPFRTLRSA